MLHADILGERARLTPGSTALVEVATGARFTYAELNARACQCAHVLCDSLQVAPGERVGVLSLNRVEYVDLLFAAAKSGIVLVPLSIRLTAHELSAIVADSGLRVLLAERAFAPLATALAETCGIICVWIDGPDSHSLTALCARASDSFERKAIDPEALLTLLYTSGTTGKPKGVMLPHRMVAWNACNTVVGWQLRADDISPVFTPLYHAGGLTVFLTPLFAIGGTIVLHNGFDAAEIWRVIAAERCTVVLGVPTIWKLLMEAPEFAEADLSSIRWLISGGAPLPQFIADAYRARGLVFKQGYGLTEVGVNCFAMTVEDSTAKPGSIGKPLMFTEARIADDSGNALADDQVGELWLRGPHVCRGYWNAPELTASVLDAGGWFHTGDMARRDADGFYYIAGRRKDMFISGGINVYPAEIEAELLQHPALADAAVVGVPHPTWGEVGAAFVVCRPGAVVAVEDVLAFLGARLARYKLPRSVHMLDELPRTPTGKVQKARLQQRIEEPAEGDRP
jgi:fatty-acyl-CoA synthase